MTLALGMTGKRLDHTLAALSAVLQYAPQRRLLVVDEVDAALAATGPVSFVAGVRERVSIHPAAAGPLCRAQAGSSIRWMGCCWSPAG